jgi:hypothetical protein
MQDELVAARKVLRKPALQFTKVALEEFLYVSVCSSICKPVLTLDKQPRGQDRRSEKHRACRLDQDQQHEASVPVPIACASEASRGPRAVARTGPSWQVLRRVRCASHPFADLAVLSRSRRCRFPNLPPVSAVDVERVHSYAGADERGYPFREVSSHYEQFRTAISALATADCVFSLAQVALTNNWARPEIADTVGVVDIVDARHPIIEEISPQPFVPNTIRFGGEYRKQMVLTGLNMGGKLRRLLSLLPDSPLLTACALQANRACRGVSP